MSIQGKSGLSENVVILFETEACLCVKKKSPLVSEGSRKLYGGGREQNVDV